MTEEYPYTVGCFKGTPINLPDTGMGLQNGQNERPATGKRDQRGQGQPGNPQQVIAAAASELGISANRLRRALGGPPPNFRKAARTLGISAQRLHTAMRNAGGR